jgi:hypothetical protein
MLNHQLALIGSHMRGLSQSAVWHILHKGQLYPFRVPHVQELQPGENNLCPQSCEWLLHKTGDECSQYNNWLQAGWPRGRSSSPSRVKNFLFSTLSRLALGLTQPDIQWVPGVKRPEQEADHSQLVLRSRKRGSIHPLPHTSSWHSA